MKEDETMIKILAIDDETEILRLIRNALAKEGYEVTCVSDPAKIEAIQPETYQLILLDIMMPGKDGFTVCQELREKVDCPILFLTAKTAEADIMKGLGLGGDDYITKPFGIGELRARVAAHLRRENREQKHTMQVGEVIFSLSSKEIYTGEQKVELTKSEYTICEYLALHRKQVFSREQIYELNSVYPLILPIPSPSIPTSSIVTVTGSFF